MSKIRNQDQADEKGEGRGANEIAGSRGNRIARAATSRQADSPGDPGRSHEHGSERSGGAQAGGDRVDLSAGGADHPHPFQCLWAMARAEARQDHGGLHRAEQDECTGPNVQGEIEPPRISRRPVELSQAARARSRCWGSYAVSNAAAWMALRRAWSRKMCWWKNRSRDDALRARFARVSVGQRVRKRGSRLMPPFRREAKRIRALAAGSDGIQNGAPHRGMKESLEQ